jgi:hypothetical protein
MPSHRSSPAIAHHLTRTDGRGPWIEKEIAWGRPIFRPPELVHPQVARDLLPLRAQSCCLSRSTGGR